ncbi:MULTISPECIES: M16 family metallopeptidase [unclassified Pseudomonas]|uniref:M16 family metallopeptidase n=1 Tax=unclassified Pseudomonas TaxID=196821 RepID=UPI00069F1A9E|nr:MULTISPECIES: pitrilysin family protein [unclassified Pseudomonas]WPN46961.1 pitrilysin family protein [Pseudomonas sp. P8_241]
MNISPSTFMLPFIAWLPLMAGAATPPATQDFVLDNGLKVVVREDHRSPIATAQLWIKAGSSYEPPGQSGLSHALEHMVYKGSSKACAGEFAAILEKLGASQNAFTGTDFTVFYQTLPSGRTGVAFEILADLMSTAELSTQDFTPELKVIQEERRMYVDDEITVSVQERLNSIAYPASGYRTPTIGWMHDLQRMNAVQLRQWYQAWYSPGNATLVVVGDVVPEQIKTLAQQHFGHLERRATPVAPAPVELASVGERSLTLHAPVTSPRLIMSFNAPSLATALDRRTAHALRLLNMLLAGTSSARITQQLQLSEAIFTEAHSEYDAFNRGDSLLTISTQLNPDKLNDADEALARLWHVIESLKSKAPESTELERAKNLLIANTVYAQDDLEGQANTLGLLETIGLDWRLADQDTDELNKVTPLDIQQVAKTYLTPERLSTAKILPEKNNG